MQFDVRLATPRHPLLTSGTPLSTPGAVETVSSQPILRKGLSVVIPVFNSETMLPHLVGRLELVLRRLVDDFELILVNDGSTDGSWRAVVAIAQSRPWIRGVDLARNYGQENAILCGMRLARFDITAILDDDLQNPPEEIPRLLEKLSEGHDVVYGVAHRERHSVWRSVGARVTKFVLQEAMGTADARNVTAFKVVRTHLRNAFAGYSAPHVAIDVLLSWGTQRFAAITVRQDPRLAGQSNYTLSKLVSHALNLLTGFSAAPMRLVGLLGAGMLCGGTILGIFAVLHGVTSLWAPVICTAAAFCGLQLMSIGLLSEYVLRMQRA